MTVLGRTICTYSFIYLAPAVEQRDLKLSPSFYCTIHNALVTAPTQRLHFTLQLPLPQWPVTF